MSGIAARFCPERRSDVVADCRRMVERLAHRGPDGRGVWGDGPVALGHLRFASTPEAVFERQPLVSADGRLAMTADVRLDNRAELAAGLGITLDPAVPIPDSALVLAAYDRWGDACPARLLGDFAFVVWDASRRALFCARDHGGVRPLLYAAIGRGVACASEAKALLALPGVSSWPDDTQIADYLVGDPADPAATFYRDVRRLPAGHTLTVAGDRLTVRPYWAPDPTAELRLSSDGEYVEAFRAIFDEAVRCRLRSSEPPAALLSGGLDSSSIAAVAAAQFAQAGAPPLLTFSCTYDAAPSADERPFQRAVLRAGGYRPREVSMDRASPLDDLDRLLDVAEGPPLGPGIASQRALYRAIREAGVRVLLDGHGGDEAVSHGDGYLTELALAGHWWALVREAGGISSTFAEPFWPLVGRLVRFSLSRSAAFRTAWQAGGRARQQVGRALGRPAGPADERPIGVGLVQPTLARRVGLEERRAERRRAHARAVRSERALHHHILTDGRQALGLEILDRAAADAGLDPRYPFWDKRLVEFCLSLPGDQKLRNGWSRSILRRAMAGVLPPEVQWRTDKTDFTPAIADGLRRLDLDRLRQVAYASSSPVAEYLDLAAVRRRYERFVAGGPASTPHDTQEIWLAAALALWLERQAGRPDQTSARPEGAFSQGLAAAAMHPNAQPPARCAEPVGKEGGE